MLVALLCASVLACDDRAHAASVSAVNLAAATEAGLSAAAAKAAKQVFSCAPKRWRGPTYSIIDFSQDSTQKRLYIVDVKSGQLLFNELVTHGKNTGHKHARKFSNKNGSLQSSLGLFRTAESYIGRHGYSMRLDGVEPGINDQARARAIVMHGADYATQEFVDKYGRLGRSWGCPAVAREKIEPIVDTIKDGSLLFAYYPDKQWQRNTRYLRCR